MLYTVHSILTTCYLLLNTCNLQLATLCLKPLTYTAYCILYTVYCTLHTVYFILYTVYCILYTVYFILYTIHVLFTPPFGCDVYMELHLSDKMASSNLFALALVHMCCLRCLLKVSSAPCFSSTSSRLCMACGRVRPSATCSPPGGWSSAMCAQDNASPPSFLLQAPLPSSAQEIVNGVHCSTMVHLQQGDIENEIGAASR